MGGLENKMINNINARHIRWWEVLWRKTKQEGVGPGQGQDEEQGGEGNR